MKTSTFVFLGTLLFGSLRVFHLAEASDGIDWHRDFDRAKAAAERSSKDLFVVFTGHGWCASCETLDREVFRQPEFIDATRDDFIHVELDENFGDSREEMVREKRHRELKSSLLCKAVPTVVLADSSGRPYTIITGYEQEGMPHYLGLLDQGRQVKKKRDVHFSNAGSAGGAVRLQELHAGLQVVAPALGSFDERNNDPILIFYKPEVNQILEAVTGNVHAIQKHYLERIEKRDVQVASRSVINELMRFRIAKDNRGAISYIEQRLESVEDANIRWELETAKQTFLEWDGQYDRALAYAGTLLASDQATGERRDQLLQREAFNLFNLKRFDEGCVHYDRLIESHQDPKKRLELVGWKSQMVAGHGTPEQRIKIHTEYRLASEAGSDHWLTATSLLADAHEKLGQRNEELKLLEGFIEKQDSPWIKLRLVDCYLALGRITNATAKMDELARDIGEMEASPRVADQEQSRYLNKQLEQLRDSTSKRKVD